MPASVRRIGLVEHNTDLLAGGTGERVLADRVAERGRDGGHERLVEVHRLLNLPTNPDVTGGYTAAAAA